MNLYNNQVHFIHINKLFIYTLFQTSRFNPGKVYITPSLSIYNPTCLGLLAISTDISVVPDHG